ncbi:2-hydroxyacid dehydrogenase [Acidihalobacter prosperus]|nr:glyoxylate/hydroxypyruvate reductase A [Acidihalobacter prosperus]
MSELDDPRVWREALQRAWPELDVRVWPATGDPDEIDFALVWQPPPGVLGSFANLRLIVNLGAGVDAIAADDSLPAHVPIARLADPGQAQMMDGYVLLAVLRHHRELHRFEQARRERRWAYNYPRPHSACRVGVMGLGYLGTHAARALAAQGFDVVGWSRSAKSLPDIETHAGPEGLAAFLCAIDILVAMLPATAETRRVIGRQVFYGLPRGAKFVSVGRGSTVDEAALLDALREGQIAEATLDVFATEPLPPEHPFWEMDQVLITPHLASAAVPETAARQVVDNCRRVLSGQMPEYVIDRARGY